MNIVFCQVEDFATG